MNRLPDRCSLEDIMYAINFIAQVLDGLKVAESVKLLTTEKLLNRVENRQNKTDRFYIKNTLNTSDILSKWKCIRTSSGLQKLSATPMPIRGKSESQATIPIISL